MSNVASMATDNDLAGAVSAVADEGAKEDAPGMMQLVL